MRAASVSASGNPALSRAEQSALRASQQAPSAAVQLLQWAAFLAPEPIPLFLFSGHPELLDEPLRSTAADPDTLTDTVGALIAYSLAAAPPTASRSTAWSRP
jgi:hypothetical protein